MSSAGRPRLRVVAVPLDARLASSRLRVVRMAEALAALPARSVDVRLVPCPRDGAGWSALRRAAEEADVVLLQKRLPGPLDARRYRALGPPIVFDFDDALPLRMAPERGSWRSRTRARRFARVLRLAAGAVAGNAHLAALARDAAPDGPPQLVLPTGIPFPVPTREHAAHGGPLAIGWIGGKGNAGELHALEPVLARLARERPLELVVVSDAPFAPGEPAAFPVRHVPWSLEGQERALAALDVGVMPLADNPWNRGKCAYKLLQYQAAGLPAVASPVGMNAALVRHGENGLLAADADAWLECLRALADDVDLRRRLGAAGRETAAGYAFPRLAERLATFLVEVAAAGPDRG